MLTIAEEAYQELRRDGERRYPREACGVLLGRVAGEAREATRAVACANVAPEGRTDRYAVDPRDLLRLQREARARGEAIVGFYHSHPDHPARWSATDLAEAHWVGCAYVITRVDAGRAGETRAFVLACDEGAGEEAKRFVDEALRIAP